MKFRDETLIDVCDGGKHPLCIASPVRRGTVPPWLEKRLRPHRLNLKQYTSDHPLLGESRWLDHWGSTENGEFVSEPYHMGEREMEDVLHFAEALDVDCQIQAASVHYPMSTLRVVFRPKKAKA
jgi:hypothetical protein